MAIDEGYQDMAERSKTHAKIVKVYSRRRPNHQISACKATQVDMDPQLLIESSAAPQGRQPTPLQPEVQTAETLSEKKSLLKLLDKHSHSRVTAVWEKRRFLNHRWLAARMACWIVVFALPVIVYPIAVRIRNWSSRGARYMGSYGLALSNYCWLLGPTLGVSTQYAVEGVIGQLLALANISILNWAFYKYLTGGANATKIEAVDLTGGSDGPIWQSSWLPLCNLGNGPRFVETTTVGEFFRQCLFNIHWTELDIDVLKPMIIVAELTLFVLFFLLAGFGQVVRMYALCYTMYWGMLFVNPALDGNFTDSPTVAWTQSIMTVVGGAIIILAHVIPFPNTAMAKAEENTKVLTLNFKVLFKALPYIADEDVRLRMHSTLSVVKLAAGHARDELRAAWWEDMDLFCPRARRRRKLTAFVGALEQIHVLMSATVASGEAMTDADVGEIHRLLPSFNGFCFSLAEVVDIDVFAQEADSDCAVALKKATDTLQKEFTSKESRAELSPRMLAFALMVCSMSARASNALESAAAASLSKGFSLWGWLGELSCQMGLPQTRSHPKHLKFALRSTFVIMVAFCFGWIGLERAINAYESEAAVTVCIVVANTTASGFSLSTIMKRLNSAVIGIVIGQAVGQVLAVQTEFHAIVFALFLWVFCAACSFTVFHSREHGGVGLCVLAIAAAGLVPANGVFREYGIPLTLAANEHLAGTVKAAVFGGALMLTVDVLIYTSARELAKAKLLESITHCWDLLAYFIDNSRFKEASISISLASLAANMHDLQHYIRQAELEPTQAGIKFPFALFDSLQGSIRSISHEIGVLDMIFSNMSGELERLFEDSEEGVSASVMTNLKKLIAARFADMRSLLTDLFDRKFVPPTEEEEANRAGCLRHEILDKTYHRETEDVAARLTMHEHGNMSRMKTRFNGTAETRSWCWLCRGRSAWKKVHALQLPQSDTQLCYSRRTHMMEQLFEELRRTAETVRGDLPTTDGLSHLELLIHVIRKIDAEAQNVCLALAKQG